MAEKKSSKKQSAKKPTAKTQKTTTEPRRLYRSNDEKMIAGVCGGIAEYFNVDPVWIRLIAILLIFLNGIGILAYIILWILVPENPNQKTKKTIVEMRVDEFKESIKNNDKKSNSSGYLIIGIILILIGLLFLYRNFWGFWFPGEWIWPLLIVAVGIVLVVRSL